MRLSAAAAVTDDPELLPDDLFETPSFHRHEQEIRYTSAEYLALLQTYCGHIELPPRALAGLLGCLRELIDRNHDGHVTKRYLFDLRLARRRRGWVGLPLGVVGAHNWSEDASNDAPRRVPCEPLPCLTPVER